MVTLEKKPAKTNTIDQIENVESLVIWPILDSGSNEKETISVKKNSIDLKQRRVLPDYTALVWNVVLTPVLFLFRRISLGSIVALFLWFAIFGLASSWVANKWMTHHRYSYTYEVASVPSPQTEKLRLLTREH